jgi:uncharacterized protein involved in tellurium resistance
MKTRYVGWINRENEDGIFLSEDPDLSKKTKTFDMTIDALGTFADILIAANIYNAGDEATWADYDGQVVVETDAGEAITTHLTAQEPGPWCVIARIDNHQSESPRVVNVNQVFDDKPDMEEFS